jgi:hypothetical protein
MARTSQKARVSTGGPAPRGSLPISRARVHAKIGRHPQLAKDMLKGLDSDVDAHGTPNGAVSLSTLAACVQVDPMAVVVLPVSQWRNIGIL